MTTVAMSTIRIAVTIPITIEMVDTSFAISLPDGELDMVMLDGKFESSVVCFVVSSVNPAVTVERIYLTQLIHTESAILHVCSDRVATSSSRCYRGSHF